MAHKPRKSKAKKPRKGKAKAAPAVDVVPAEPNPRGRPSEFRPEFIEIAARLCEEGATDFELAEYFGVSEVTLNAWKHRHPAFLKSIRTGKDVADERVERSLYNRAVGYKFRSEKIFQYEGAVVRAETVEHVPPDTKAAIRWLENRRRAQWAEKIPPAPPVGPGLTVVIQQAIGGPGDQAVTTTRVAVALPQPT